MADDAWTGKDKAQHFVASALLAAAGSEYAKHQHINGSSSAGIGLLFSLSIGAGKEAYDSRPSGSGWSWKDFSWDLAGAATGYTLWTLSQ
ncbi:putative lipoprotein [Izhakiella capsodis]|uniref:Putative lipoprotein n=2 Tax=Izhakiella capsodis TaxID=1367852 RepID=A0A1I4UAG3_9GAMM|nr:putative lipoprotein [Izhakiella capsodis]